MLARGSSQLVQRDLELADFGGRLDVHLDKLIGLVVLGQAFGDDSSLISGSEDPASLFGSEWRAISEHCSREAQSHLRYR